MVAITILIMLVLVFGVSGVVMYKLIKTSAPDASQSVLGHDNSANSKDFIAFENIEGNVMDLGGHQYRAIIECSSINYGLLSVEEQQMVDISFQRFLNSLTYPIMIFIGTRMIDNTNVIKDLEEDAAINIQKFPKMREYAENYIAHMQEICSYINNDRQKKKYIVVPYGDAVGMTELSESEIKEFSVTELMTRVMALKDNIEAIGLKATVLDEAHISELLYSIQHRNNYHIAKYIMEGEFTPLVVTGENKEGAASKDIILKTILKECENKMKAALVDYNIDTDESNLYQKISKMLSSSSTLISEAGDMEEIKGINFEKDVENYESLTFEADEIISHRNIEAKRSNGFNGSISDEDLVIADMDDDFVNGETESIGITDGDFFDDIDIDFNDKDDSPNETLVESDIEDNLNDDESSKEAE